MSRSLARHVLVLFNPQAGGRSGLPAVDCLAAELRHAGLPVSIFDDAHRFTAAAASCWASRELRAVVAAGGDGTVALVANHIEPETPVAVLPLGTENLLAKHFRISTDPLRVCRMVCRGTATRIDAGRAGDRLFLLMLGCGFDAEVVRRVHGRRQGNIHHFSYAKPILDSIRSYPYPEIRVYCEAQSDVDLAPDRGLPSIRATDPQLEIAARWVFVVNLPRYALGLQLVPDASGSDGLLDVCAFKKGSFLSGLHYLGHVLRGTHASSGECTIARARRLRLESEEPVPYQLDGDPGGLLPVDIEVLPNRLTLLTDESPCGGAPRSTGEQIEGV